MSEWATRFDEAMRLKGRQEFQAAAEVLLALLEEGAPTQQHEAAALGELGGLCLFDLDDPQRAVVFYQKCVAISPESELASVGLFHSLILANRVADALDEMKRYISSNRSTEYDLLVAEIRRALRQERSPDGGRPAGGESTTDE